jgi:hypothetical protein
MADEDLPGFCDACWCETCWRGFYTAVRHGIKLPDQGRRRGEYKCALAGCIGTIRVTPLFNWTRIAPCVDTCARLKKGKA